MQNNCNGFTLIEFLVALVILMVGLLGLLQSINLAMEKSVETVYRNEASVLANERIAQCSSLSFNEIVFNKWTTMQRAPRGGFKNYSVQTIVTSLTTGPLDLDGTKLANTASKQIDVNVHWTVKSKGYSHSASSVISTSNEQ
ncbi:MAG: prepilin-type N-terminal cleavage/methylation domain-containing protein [Desulfuromonadaceae bacterium]|nr:prepilin-type N-terminal cleavage/methylation domain-containing protein [Desulfuromonadaceae bacterium]